MKDSRSEDRRPIQASAAARASCHVSCLQPWAIARTHTTTRCDVGAARNTGQANATTMAGHTRMHILSPAVVRGQKRCGHTFNVCLLVVVSDTPAAAHSTLRVQDARDRLASHMPAAGHSAS